MATVRAQQRYRELVEQLAAEHGNSYGWAAAVARQLDVHRSTLGRIMRAERRASDALIQRAVDALGLDAGFFKGAGHYTDFLVAGHPSIRPSVEYREAAVMAAGTRELLAFLKATADDDARARLRSAIAIFDDAPLVRGVRRARAAVDDPSSTKTEMMEAATELFEIGFAYGSSVQRTLPSETEE